MERTVTSTATKETSTAEFDGWNLTFVIETGDGKTNVSVNGQKGAGYVNGFANSDSSSNVGFSQGTYDAALATAIFAEMDAIINPVA